MFALSYRFSRIKKQIKMKQILSINNNTCMMCCCMFQKHVEGMSMHLF
jgi:hypothetical protein